MQRRRLNPLFPVSVSLGSGVACWYLVQVLAAGSVAEQAAYSVVGLLVALGVLEHWFLVLPIQDSRLWQWAMADDTPEPESRVLGTGGL